MKTLKILVADDSLGYRLFMDGILTNLGHKCVMARNGQEVIEAVQSNGIFDLLFMDIEMPELNGIDTARKIRNELAPPHNRLPIIGLTSYGADFFDQKLRRWGFNDYLNKDCTQQQVNEKICKVMEEND